MVQVQAVFKKPIQGRLYVSTPTLIGGSTVFDCCIFNYLMKVYYRDTIVASEFIDNGQGGHGIFSGGIIISILTFPRTLFTK